MLLGAHEKLAVFAEYYKRGKKFQCFYQYEVLGWSGNLKRSQPMILIQLRNP